MAIANRTAKVYFPWHVLLMLLEEKTSKRCSCTSESVVSNDLSEMNILCVFYKKLKKLNSSRNVKLPLESVLA